MNDAEFEPIEKQDDSVPLQEWMLCRSTFKMAAMFWHWIINNAMEKVISKRLQNRKRDNSFTYGVTIEFWDQLIQGFYQNRRSIPICSIRIQWLRNIKHLEKLNNNINLTATTSWVREVNSCSAVQQILDILCTSKFQCRVYRAKLLLTKESKLPSQTVT